MKLGDKDQLLIIKNIKLPKALDLDGSLAFSLVLSQVEEADEYIIDFSNVGTIEPFGLLLVSSEIQRLIQSHPNSKCEFINYKNMTYAGTMGFFKAFGCEFGKAPGEALGSSRYLPIRILNSDEMRRVAETDYKQVGEVIEERSKELSSILCGASEGDINETLTYSIREIMRNIVEHSESKKFGMCAQYWPSKNKVEVAIIDRGVGIRKTLSANHHLSITDNKAAINYALMPAISGKAFKGSKIKQKGPWANSGFGLYMTNRICRNGGTFFIASGDTGMLLTKGVNAKKYYSCAFQGTAIRMVIKTDSLIELRAALEKFRNEGYEINKTYKEITRIDPSSASLMLSEDFDLSLWKKLRDTLRIS